MNSSPSMTLTAKHVILTSFVTCLTFTGCGSSDSMENDMKETVDLSQFVHEKHFWTGTLDVPWLADRVEFLVFSREAEIPAEHKAIVEFITHLRPGTRKQLEKTIFNKYQSEIFESVAGGEQATPRLAETPDIWKLLSSPTAAVPPINRIESNCYFAIYFECAWDSEHGLSVLFSDSGVPIDVSGQGDHF